MPSKIRLDVAAIRKLATQRVGRSSLRSVADEIGISKSGLDSFVKGREPYSKTRAKLAAWYARERQRDQDFRPEDVDAAIAVLAHYIQGVGRESVREGRVREVAERLFQTESPSPRKR